MLNLRTIEVMSPIPGLEFEHMRGEETLGRPFTFNVDLLGKSADVKLSDAVGKSLTVAISMGAAPPRFFNGIITRFSQVGWTGEHFQYSARVQPWLWLLSRATNSRIFQKQDYASILDVLAKIFDEHGFSGDVDDKKIDKGDHPCPDYLVQYHETDLNFVSRLMEQVGIYYSFHHEKGKHTLVLHEGPAQDTVPGYKEIPFFAQGSKGAAPDRDHQYVDSWSVGLQVEPGAYVAKEFDFENPRAPLLSATRAPKDHPYAALETYEYPGHYIDDTQRVAYTRRRLEEQQLPFEVAEGTGNARGITPGTLFSLTEHPAINQNRQYLVTGVAYALSSNAHTSGGSQAEDEYQCHFSAVDGKLAFRTPVTTPKPRVEGPQTAIVAGAKGQEIWTDKYGRVKVQFHWDRAGASNENSSCWVRVSQAWAGTNWGAMHIPRVGQEVIVDFLEGDPDRPLITGRVYNRDNMPPYDLPANQTQSGIKSRSTQGGAPSNFNEIRFEDKKGAEQVYGQAEKDLDVLVKNDEHRAIGHDRSTEIKHDETVTVGHDRTEQVTSDESVSIGGSRTETVAKSESVTVGASRDLTVAVSDSNTVGGAHDLNVGGSDSTTVGGSQSVSVGGSQSTSVGGSQSVDVGKSQSVSVAKDQSVSIAGGRTLDVTKDDKVSVAGKRTVNVSKDYILEITKKLSINVTDEISITTGDATISLKKNGDITIKGKNLTLEGSGKVNVKASGDLILKGSKIAQN